MMSHIETWRKMNPDTFNLNGITGIFKLITKIKGAQKYSIFSEFG